MPGYRDEPLRIVHVLRAPLGGLFRHVVDLTREQTARGHHVGLICDSTTGGDRAVEVLESLRPSLELGVMRTPMHRLPHPTDVTALARIAARLAKLKPDVVHGHGAKGAAYARAPGILFPGGPVRAYTPHGGSFNYKPGSAAHGLYMTVEKLLGYATDLLLFESAYIGRRYDSAVSATNALRRVIVNGVSPAELQPVEPAPDAADLFYIGELRSAKGIDTLIDSLPLIEAKVRRRPTLVLVGTGPDRQILEQHASAVGYSDNVRFAGAMPARKAFELGQALVVPSRAESLPYVVLEAAGACVPMVATNVGGIPEIFGPLAGRLIPCDDAPVLADAVATMLNRPRVQNLVVARQLATYVGNKFTLSNMVEGVLAGYREAIARKHPAVAAARAPASHRPAE
ncbi:MAG: glycosyltransferase family 4 protein [Hyphomicrobiales bacterium]|nr:glycosyltransferase family 4 protein [Hyphomicrobiales bacterium]